MDRERVVDLYCSELEDQMRRDYPAVLAEKNRILADKAQAALAVVRALDDLMRRAGLKGTLTFHGADAPPSAFVGGKP